MVTCQSNKKACVTAALFEECLQTVANNDATVIKSPIIIDNFTAHPNKIKNLIVIKFKFLLPKATSELQLVNQGVIHSYKKLYRKKLIQQIFANLENDMQFYVNLLIAA